MTRDEETLRTAIDGLAADARARGYRDGFADGLNAAKRYHACALIYVGSAHVFPIMVSADACLDTIKDFLDAFKRAPMVCRIRRVKLWVPGSSESWGWFE